MLVQFAICESTQAGTQLHYLIYTGNNITWKYGFLSKEATII